MTKSRSCSTISSSTPSAPAQVEDVLEPASPRSDGLTPAIGSSSSRMRGSAISARTRSSSFPSGDRRRACRRARRRDPGGAPTRMRLRCALAAPAPPAAHAERVRAARPGWRGAASTDVLRARSCASTRAASEKVRTSPARAIRVRGGATVDHAPPPKKKERNFFFFFFFFFFFRRRRHGRRHRCSSSTTSTSSCGPATAWHGPRDRTGHAGGGGERDGDAVEAGLGARRAVSLLEVEALHAGSDDALVLQGVSLRADTHEIVAVIRTMAQGELHAAEGGLQLVGARAGRCAGTART